MTHRTLLFATLAGAMLAAGGARAEACGGETACRVDGGNYRIELPPAGKPRGALVFFHGYQSSAEQQMRHRALVETAQRHGLAFVAPDGLNRTWSHPNAPAQDRDERAFVSNVLDDLTARFGFDASNTLVGGFSQGASMAWYSVCQQGERFAGAVVFSGTFWNPLPKPEDCVAAVPPLVQFHGTADTTFPLAGRPIGDKWHQGDTNKSMAILRQRAACAVDLKETTIDHAECQAATGCARGSISLCLFDGGHQVDAKNLDAGLTALGF